jgi:hypothetical protein
MPVKESTLRFKVEGLQDVQGAVGQLKQAARDMRADQVALERTHRVVQEQLNAGRFPSETARKNALAAEENQQRTISNISFKAENDRRWTAVRFLDQQYSQDIESFKGGTEQKAAYEATYEQKRRKLVQEIAADETKAFEKKEMDSAKAYHAEQKAAEQEAKSWNRKLIAADQYAKKAEVSSGQSIAKEVSYEQKAAGERARIAAEDEAASQKAYVRTGQRQIKAIAERTKAEERAAEESGGGKGGMSGFGGKMLLGYAAGNAAAEISGNVKAGEMIGSGVSGFMFGGPVVGGAIVAMQLVGQRIQSSREELVEATQAAREYAGALMEAGRAWSEPGLADVERSPFGKQMQSEVGRAGDAFLKVNAGITDYIQSRTELQEFSGPGGLSWNPLIDAMGGLSIITGQYDVEQTHLAGMRKLKDEERKIEADARAARKAEYPVFESGEKNILKAKLQANAVEKMAPGYIKEKEALEAKINQTVVQCQEQFKRESYSEIEGINKLGQTYNELRAAYVNMTVAEQKSEAGAEAKQAALEAYGKYEDALEARRTAAGQRQRIEELGLSSEAAARAKFEMATTVAVEGRLAPYLSEAAANQHRRDMENAHRQLMDAAKAKYGDTWWTDKNWAAIEKQVAGEMALYETGEQVLQQKRSKIELDSAALRITFRDAEIQRELAADPLTRGGRTKENAERYDAIVAAANAKADVQDQLTMTQLLTQAQQQGLAAQYEAHKLSEMDYETQRLALEMKSRGFPMEAAWVKDSIAYLAKQKVYNDAEADTWRYKQSAAETELQYMTKRHMISLKDADLTGILLQDRTAYEAFEAVKAEKANEQQKELVKDVEAEVSARERLRGTEMYNAGQFSTKYSAGYVNFAALNQSRMYGALRGPGSFETGQAGQTFLPSTVSPRWPGETPGAGKGASPTPGPSKADVDRAKADAEILRSATQARLNSDKDFRRAFDAAKSRQHYDADILRRSEAATVQSPSQIAVGAKGGDGSNSVVGELKEICRILQHIAANGGLN